MTVKTMMTLLQDPAQYLGHSTCSVSISSIKKKKERKKEGRKKEGRKGRREGGKKAGREGKLWTRETLPGRPDCPSLGGLQANDFLPLLPPLPTHTLQFHATCSNYKRRPNNPGCAQQSTEEVWGACTPESRLLGSSQCTRSVFTVSVAALELTSEP